MIHRVVLRHVRIFEGKLGLEDLIPARHLLAEAVAFIAEIRAEKLGSYDESEAKEIADALARCDAAMARLKANRAG